MKILLSWLKDYVDIDVSCETLVEKLFSSGFEVEETKYLGENIEKIVVGEITSLEHYEGTHLQICHMNCGKHGEDIVILTGADNVFKGARVPAALVGAKLPNGMEIAPRKMQGMMSYGMLCSGEELGIDENWIKGAGVHGILILPEDAPIGEDIVKVLELDDYLLDVSITANRPDCQSVLGIAREVSAFLRKPLKMPDLGFTPDEVKHPAISVDVIAKDLCPRYLGHYIYDVQHFESPQWMKRRLSVCGFAAIDAIVDITNYVLLEMGQPMHAYDLSTLEGPAIVVRRANNGEEMVTLDEKSHTLTENNLLICDSTKGVGLAGIMGGLNSEIVPTTKEILLEAAKFLRDNIRKTSRALGLHTDAAARFEKGIDEYGVECGMARALNLVQTLGVAKVSASAYDVSAGASREERVISVEVAKVNAVLGIEVPEKDIVEILKSLNFGVTINGGTMEISIPRYREDVEHYQDIAEEVIREYGYEHVVPTFLKTAEVTNGGLSFAQSKELECKKFLCTQGYYEVQTIAMYSRRELALLMLPEDAPEHKAVELLNPITEHLSIMRTSMAPAMINVIEENLKNEHNEGRFFELANIYLPKSLPLTEAPEERKILCIGAFGKDEDFFSVKESVEAFAQANGLTFRFERGCVPYLHPGITADIYCGGEKIGCMGKLRYEVIEKLNIAEGKKDGLNIILVELNYSALNALFKTEIKYTPDSGHNCVVRDLSIIAEKKTTCVEVTDVIGGASELVSNVEFIDLYESDKLGADKKSLTFTITLASATEDVSDEMADGAMAEILAQLDNKLGAKMRT